MLLASETITAVIVGFAIWFIKGYLNNTGWKKIIKLQLQVIEKTLENLDVDVPKFLQKIIDELHKSDENTEEIEKIYQDERMKRLK